MKFKSLFTVAVLATFIFSCTSVESLEKRPIGLINSVSYTDSAFDNLNASNGFLVEHNNKVYGITAKHVLMIAKTDDMKVIDFEGGLKQWKMHPKNDETTYVIMDELLSSNRRDSLNWAYFSNNWETYDDWLVFSVKENTTKHKPLKFRDTPLVKGENLYAIGWTYKDTTGTQRMYEYQYKNTEGNYHNLVQIKGPKSLGGLSGAPIVDEKGTVVGLVSSGGEDEVTKEISLQATSTKNMRQFIGALE